MIRLIEGYREELEQLCRKFSVGRLELFGSAVESMKFDQEHSDLDFLVEFQPLRMGEHADAYFGLLEALENLFHRHIDLVMPRAVKNPYFMESINRMRQVIYAA